MLCKQKPLITITGSTAIGKTKLGIQVAGRLRNAEIVSVDSRQVYRHMDIGTAKPSIEERKQVRHYFIDTKNPDEPYSAGHYSREARKLIQELWSKGIIPVMVGGSGLYLQAVLDGFFVDEGDYGEDRSNLQRRLTREGLEALFVELGRLDPQAQSRTAPNDTQRILRALELAQRGKGQVRRWQDQTRKPLDCLPLMFCLTMERDQIYRRIEQRVDRMVAEGLVEEVNKLVEMGYGRGCLPMGSLGYREILDFLEGKCSLEGALELIKGRSRKYAKRQQTWFRRDRRLRWLDVDRWGSRGVIERIEAQFGAEMG